MSKYRPSDKWLMRSPLEGVVMSGDPIVRLGRVLYEAMEHLDPGFDDYVKWDDSSEREREFCVLCVKAILQQRALVDAALASDNHVSRHSHKRK